MKCMAHFMALQGKPPEWKKIRVGILTFYKAQKKLIEDTLKEKHLEACAAVKTVNASQGKIAHECICIHNMCSLSQMTPIESNLLVKVSLWSRVLDDYHSNYNHKCQRQHACPLDWHCNDYQTQIIQ